MWSIQFSEYATCCIQGRMMMESGSAIQISKSLEQRIAREFRKSFFQDWDKNFFLILCISLTIEILAVGFLSVGISVLVGTSLGAMAGFYRGRLDGVLSRFTDLLLAFPFLIFAIGVMAFLGPGFVNLILALTFKGWVEFFRLVRGEMMSEKHKEYVEAGKVVGQSNLAIISNEILPNIIQSVFEPTAEFLLKRL